MQTGPDTPPRINRTATVHDPTKAHFYKGRKVLTTNSQNGVMPSIIIFEH
jgi:hypothetical protein